MRPDRHMFTRIWSTEEGLTALLVLLLLFVFVLHPVVELYSLPRVLVQIFFSMILISGVGAVARGRSATRLTALFAMACLVVGWASHVSPSKPLALANATLATLFCALLTFLILKQVLAAGPVTRHRIEGAVAVYLLLGLGWAFAYKVIDVSSPHAFSFSSPGSAVSGDQLTATMAYFSFVTLTTVGYGDVLPVSQAARTLAILEALTGQLFPAVLLARLVSLELYYRQSSSRAPSDDVDD